MVTTLPGAIAGRNNGSPVLVAGGLLPISVAEDCPKMVAVRPVKVFGTITRTYGPKPGLPVLVKVVVKQYGSPRKDSVPGGDPCVTVGTWAEAMPDSAAPSSAMKAMMWTRCDMGTPRSDDIWLVVLARGTMSGTGWRRRPEGNGISSIAPVTDYPIRRRIWPARKRGRLRHRCIGVRCGFSRDSARMGTDRVALAASQAKLR